MNWKRYFYCNQSSFGFAPELFDVLTLLDVHLYVLVLFVRTRVIPSINHSTPKPLRAEPGTHVELQIVEETKCRHTSFLTDMSPFVTYVCSYSDFQNQRIFAAFVALPATAITVNETPG